MPLHGDFVLSPYLSLSSFTRFEQPPPAVALARPAWLRTEDFED